MIRVDSMEQYEELRSRGFTDDILVLMKGGENDGKEKDSEEAVSEDGEVDSKDSDTETGENDATPKFDYDKVIEGVAEKLKPLIQESNRNRGADTQDTDSDLDSIMKKFAEM